MNTQSCNRFQILMGWVGVGGGNTCSEYTVMQYIPDIEGVCVCVCVGGGGANTYLQLIRSHAIDS